MNSSELIAEARKLDAETTKGPWIAERNNVMATERLLIAYTGSESFPYHETKAAAAFIARARTLLPQLADALQLMEEHVAIVDGMALAYQVRAEAAEARLAKAETLLRSLADSVSDANCESGPFHIEGIAYAELEAFKRDRHARPMEDA